MKTFKELTDALISRWSEAVKRKVVVRGGIRQVKKVTDKAGFKMVGGKEVKMDAKEKMKRKKGAKIAARKAKSKNDWTYASVPSVSGGRSSGGLKHLCCFLEWDSS